jgi:hypothetical protein
MTSKYAKSLDLHLFKVFSFVTLVRSLTDYNLCLAKGNTAR